MTYERHPRILVGRAWSIDNSAIVDGLQETADVEVFDLFDTARTAERLAHKKIDVVIGPIGWVDLMSVYAILLSRVGTTIDHIACQMDSNIEMPPERQEVLGICATVPKNATLSRWNEMIHSITAGSRQTIPHPSYTERLSRESSCFTAAHFSDIDEQIVSLVAEGYTNPEIADVLHYASQTIRNRVSSILTECGCRNRTELASAWQRHRLHETHHRIVASAPSSARGPAHVEDASEGNLTGS
jgi:DNA-binding NarL/FixJ family response regulator